jgi:6-phosphogluconolactonase
MDLRISETPKAVAKSLAEAMKEWCTDPSFRHIALSGGSTPKLLFDILAEDYRDVLPWEALEFYWGDERCVPPTDPDSNYGMTLDRLFSRLDIPQAHIHRIAGENDPQEEAERYGALIGDRLPKVAGTPRFDLIILGLGTDGHTASIFPHEMQLWDAEAVCAVATHPESGQKRITLTGQVINRAARVVFLVTGPSKASRVREIIKGAVQAKAYPAARVAPKDGRLIWMLDEDAATGLAQDS